MQFDATGASLPDLFRSLNVDPQEKEALIRLAETVRRLEHEREYQAMLFGEPPPPPPPSPAPRRRTPPEKRWLKVVRDPAVLLAPAGAFVRGHVRHAIAVSAGAVVLAGGTLAPDLMRPAAVPPASAAVHHHATARHHYPARAPEELPAVVPPRRKRRRVDSHTVAPSPSPSPSGSPSPGPDPSPTGTDPSPLPSVTVPPVPTPTCTILHGNHCHGGDVVGDAVGALRGLPAYHDLS